MKTRLWYLCLLPLLTWLSLSSVQAQEPSTELSELRERLDNLERQNIELRSIIADRLPDQHSMPAGEDEMFAEPMLAETIKADEPQEIVVNDDTDMVRAGWKDGYLWFESQSKSFRTHVGGRTQIDSVFLQAPQNVANGLGGSGVRDAVDFRRARVRVEGTMWETMDYTMEYDFMNAFNVNDTTPIEEVAPLDLWWGF